MSKRVKILISVVVAILLLAMGTTATVMAQEEPPEVSAKGLLARVAEILGIPEEDLINAFNQAQQEIREEAFDKWLDKAVERGLITQEKANEIKEWWEQRPEALDRSLFPPALGFPSLRGHMFGGHRGWQPGLGRPSI